jgi:FAD synthase
VNVVSSPSEVEQRPRAVAVGSFDGVHRGHVAVLGAAAATGLATTADHLRSASSDRLGSSKRSGS